MILINSSIQSDPSGSAIGTAVFPFNNLGGGFMLAACFLDSLAETVDGSGVFYSGVQLTELFTTKLTATSLWVGYLRSPSLETHNFAVNFTGTVSVFRTVVVTYTGVDVANPFGGFNSNTASGSSTPFSTTVTVSGASGLVQDFFYGSRVTAGNATSPQVEEFNIPGTWGGGVDHLGGASWVNHTGSNVTMEWENLTGQAALTKKIIYAQELLPASTTSIPQVLFI